MKRPLRLAIASRQVSGITGTTTTIIEHSRRLRALGCEVHVYGETLDRERLEASGAAPHRLPGWLWGSRVKRRLFAWMFERAVRRQRFDLVWGHGDILRQDILSLHNCVHAAHEAVHGVSLPGSSGVGLIHRRILTEGGFRRIIANSRLMRDDLAARFGVPASSVEVIHPGHDPERFCPEGRGLGRSVRAELGVGEVEVLLGLISSGDFAKRGVRQFLRALARVDPGLRERLRVLVMGRESRLTPYRSLAAETGLGDRIRFMAPVHDVERFYHALDVYVHPALFEEFGQSVQEAMACGVAVLTNARVGASELLGPKARELILVTPEVEPLRLGIERLASDPELRGRWADVCRQAARGNTWDRNFRLTWACVEGMLPGREKK